MYPPVRQLDTPRLRRARALSRGHQAPSLSLMLALLALILCAALLVVTAPAPRGDHLTATTIDDHPPSAWHFEHRGSRLVAVAR